MAMPSDAIGPLFDPRRAAATERQRRFRERKYAEGKHYVRGYITDTPRVKRSKGEEPPHGTVHRYRWSYGPCRCGPCRTANAARAREDRIKKKERDNA